MISAVGKRLIVKPIEAAQGTIIVTNQKPTLFSVLSIGDEVTKVKVGTIIFLDKIAGKEIEHAGEKFLVIDEASILAKLD